MKIYLCLLSSAKLIIKLLEDAVAPRTYVGEDNLPRCLNIIMALRAVLLMLLNDR